MRYYQIVVRPVVRLVCTRVESNIVLFVRVCFVRTSKGQYGTCSYMQYWYRLFIFQESLLFICMYVTVFGWEVDR